LKFRQPGQGTTQELKEKDFRRELDTRERKFELEKQKDTAWLAKEEEKVDVPLLLKNQAEIDIEKLQNFDDKDVEIEDSDGFDSSS
jgi:hypothetical protein